MRKSFILLAIIPPIVGSSHNATLPNKERWITIFIHGTILHRPLISWRLVKQYLEDTIEDTLYAHTVKASRHHALLLQLQPMQQLGLHTIATDTIEDSSPVSWFAHTYQEADKIRRPHALTAYYTFGWEGLLSDVSRKEAAKSLQRELSKLVHHHKGIHPEEHIKISIIGFSHGGTVAALLAETRHANLTIDELVLLGVPATNTLNKLLAHNIFKNVYHFYSRADFYQGIGCTTSKKICFQRRLNVEDHQRLKQVEMKLFKLTHAAPRKGIDYSPLHSEWWFFGWTPGEQYRTRSPLYPLPLASHLPLILKATDELPDNERSLVCEYTPQRAHIVFRKRHSARRTQCYIPTPSAWNRTINKMLSQYSQKITYAEYAQILYSFQEEVGARLNASQIKSKSPIDICCARNPSIASATTERL